MQHFIRALCLLSVVSFIGANGCSSTKEPPNVQSRPAAHGRIVTEIDQRIWCICQDRVGNYWFGSNGAGVFRFDGSILTQFDTDHGLGGNQVRDIKEDRHGNIFVSTNSAVAMFDGTSFTALEISEAPADGSAWVLDPDDVWLVHDPGRNGPFRWDGETLYHMTLSTSPAEDASSRVAGRRFTGTGVYHVSRDRSGHLWFGTAGVGLCRFDGTALSWLFEERLTTTPQGGAFGIRSIYEDRDGHVWICNTRQRFEMSGETAVIDGHRMIVHETLEGLPDAQTDASVNFEYFPAITEDQDGVLWFACGSAGIWKYDGESVAKYDLDDDSWAITICCDHEGVIWVGTVEHGIYRGGAGGFESFSRFWP